MDSFDCYFAYRMFRVITQLCVLIAQFITLYTRICIPHSTNESLWSILHSTRNPTARRERSSSSDMERYCWYVHKCTCLQVSLHIIGVEHLCWHCIQSRTGGPSVFCCDGRNTGGRSCSMCCSWSLLLHILV